MYRIEQVAAGNNWQVRGPGMRDDDPCFSRDEAERIAAMLSRAFACAQALYARLTSATEAP